jgi:hypothetical protein
VNGVQLDTTNTVSRRDGFAMGLAAGTYRGSVTVSIAEYLRTKVGISEFKNTNIYGNKTSWGSTLDSLTFKNVGFIGQYNGFRSKFAGIIDVDNIINIIENNASHDAMLVLHQNPASSMGFAGFKVVDASKITSSFNWAGNSYDSSNYTPPVVIIYPGRSAAQGFGGAPGPDYRAYVNSGADNATYPYKFAAANISGDTGNKVSSLRITGQVPRLQDNIWEAIGNGTQTYGNICYSNLANVPTAGKFSSMSGDGITLAPSRSDTYLAGGMPAWARSATPLVALPGGDDPETHG